MTTPEKKDPTRTRDLAQIHIAKVQLAMSDADYRAMLQSVFNISSASGLDWQARKLLIDHFKKLGFKVTAKSTARTGPKRIPLVVGGEASKARALWLFMADLGVVNDRSEQSLTAYVKRITGVESMQWVSSLNMEKLIESLKSWAMRFLPEKLDQQIVILRDELNNGLRSDVNEMDFGRLNDLVNQAYARKTFDAYETAYSHIQQILKSANDSAK